MLRQLFFLFMELTFKWIFNNFAVGFLAADRVVVVVVAVAVRGWESTTNKHLTPRKDLYASARIHKDITHPFHFRWRNLLTKMPFVQI